MLARQNYFPRLVTFGNEAKPLFVMHHQQMFHLTQGILPMAGDPVAGV